MNYIDQLIPESEVLPYTWIEFPPLIKNSQVQRSLEKLGYETVSIQSSYSVSNNKNVDFYHQLLPVEPNSFEKILLRNTALSLFGAPLKNFVYFLTYENHFRLVLFALDVLEDVPKYSGAQFVYAHIVSPHPPFVFDEFGNYIENNSAFFMRDGNDFLGTKDEYRIEYTQQVTYLNGEVIELVDAILANSDTPPIILIQADHGSGMLTDFNSIENTCLRERFSPFAAYYLPGVSDDKIPADITPVNLFRIVFSEYFDAELPLLENRYFYYRGYYEITAEQIDAPCEPAS